MGIGMVRSSILDIRRLATKQKVKNRSLKYTTGECKKEAPPEEP